MINAQTGYCTFPMCPEIEDREGFCIGHARHFAGPKPDRVKKAIPKQSAKRKLEQRVYVRIVKRKLTENEKCEIKAPGCKGKASGLHHPQKRSPATWLNESELIPACNNCQAWVEKNPAESIELGFSKSKFLK